MATMAPATRCLRYGATVGSDARDHWRRCRRYVQEVERPAIERSSWPVPQTEGPIVRSLTLLTSTIRINPPSSGTVRLRSALILPSFSLQHDAAQGLYSRLRRGLPCGRCYAVHRPPYRSHAGPLRDLVGRTADGRRRIRRNGQPRCRTGVNVARGRTHLRRRSFGQSREHVHQDGCAVREAVAEHR